MEPVRPVSVQRRATPWHVRVYRSYRTVVRSDRFLMRRFIAAAAARNDAPVDVCVDLGAGSAPYKQAISAQFSPNAYVAADFFPGDEIDVVGDAAVLPLRSGSADLVVCFEALQHVRKYHEMLNETVRILRPYGHLLLSVPFMYCECDVVDFRRWTTAGIVQELEERGFSPVLVERRGGPVYAAVNMIIWTLQHIVPGSRARWRSSRTAGAYVREAVVNVLTVPFTLLCWPAFMIDRLLPQSGFYAGTFIFARLDRSRREAPEPVPPAAP